MKPEDYLEVVDEVLVNVGRRALTKAQRPIVKVTDSDRVLQILAGPGSGKTEMLVWRVLYEAFVRETPSNRLMVTTFTRRAATELQVRLVERCDEFMNIAARKGLKITDRQIHDLRIGTIHSLCDGLLAEFDSDYMAAGTQLIDEMEVSVRLIRDYRRALGFDSTKRRVVNRLIENVELTSLFCAPWVDCNLWPGLKGVSRAECLSSMLNQHTETWLPRCGSTGKNNGVELVHGPVGLTDDLVKLQSRWEDYQDSNSILDFTTVQKRFLDRQECVLDEISHVFVDEFQDNNPIQFAIHVGWLKRPDTKLTVVGDDDQGIYRFRGSDINCFNSLEPYCKSHGIAYRIEKLETNHRSTKSIVSFSQHFKDNTVLSKLSMPKTISAAHSAPAGSPVRLLQGPWDELCKCVAQELDSKGVGRIPVKTAVEAESAAVMIFSTSEKPRYRLPSRAMSMKIALINRGMRVYNPRNKTASSYDSPIAELLGVISYLIDPVSLAPIGVGGRLIEVYATMRDDTRRAYALSKPPEFNISDDHVGFQKHLIKSNGGRIGNPAPDVKALTDYADIIRKNLILAHKAGEKVRLSLAGFISRILSFPRYRNSGFTPYLFRQSLFTTMLEANIAPTRLSSSSLDNPLKVDLEKKKYMWPGNLWAFLHVFGSLLRNTSLDDAEVESFEENAALILTFHQGKGLEFDHVYVAGTGREPDLSPALRTKLFSGEKVKYRIKGGRVQTKDKDTHDLSSGDRERESYVAITRAKKSLTILHDPKDNAPNMSLNPALEAIFKRRPGKNHHHASSVTVKEYKHE